MSNESIADHSMANDQGTGTSTSQTGTRMDLSYIKKIIKLLENSNVDEVEIEEEGKRVRVARNRASVAPLNAAYYPIPPHMVAPTSAPAPSVVATAPAAKATPAYHEVRSPIVGTFYRAPSPDADSYVDVGQTVKIGTVLCIVEAMKLMNEIESDAEGKVIKVLVENGKPVEYNQVLFWVEKI
jgi:acetyl-CoA carboxylase biotin carboxyl carrier protein